MGKTTLTQHLIFTLSSRPNEDRVPLLVRARDYDLQAPLLLGLIVSSLQEMQIANATEEGVEHLLALDAVVIFHGLDEILDLVARRRFIKSVSTMSDAYPLSSFIVTTRRVGYDQASLPNSKFTHYILEPFTKGQVREYVERWFHQDATKTESLLREAEDVPDLAQIPLLLSLLCTLYKSRGHIPRNRRQVYLQCADLLFNRWDSMRAIDQPVDHQQHGQDLMQDLALWFFRSNSAQRGVEERQLVKLLANFFIDNAGVMRAEAEARARNFLDFCAERAWLLGKAGTNEYGECLFVFTHRTFMEFFAAEGLVRSDRDTKALVDVLLNAYATNAGSVLPELIVQAAGSVSRDAPRRIQEEIRARERIWHGKGEGRFLDLRLRLFAVSTVNPRMLDTLLVEALVTVNTLASSSVQIFLRMLGLPRDQRAD